jgi:hypothetical protein
MSNPCDNFVAAFASGGPIRRWRALRHAHRCPRCAATRDALRQVTEALTEVQPLTGAERGLWLAAAGSELPDMPSLVWWVRPALAATIVVALGALWAVRHMEHRDGAPTVVDVQPPPTIKTNSPNLGGLRVRVVALAQELDDLRARADLLDARKDIDALTAQLASRHAPSGL